MRILVGVVAAGGVAFVLWVALSRENRPRHTTEAPSPQAVEPARAPSSGAPPPQEPHAALRAGLANRIAAEEAAALRRELRTDPLARRRAEEALLDPGTPRDLRMALALVLGTIGSSDDVLLEALVRFADDAGMARCLVLALGATREPAEDDDVFDLGDRPWGVRGPAGLGITVRRRIEDPHVRQALAGALAHGDEAVRRAAAQALRHSLGETDARDALLAAVQRESADGTAMEMGEALAAWAERCDEATKARILDRLLARAGEEGLDAYRFRMEDDLGRTVLGPADRAVLQEYAHPSRAFGVRSFALTVLASSAPLGGDAVVAETRALLRRTAAADPDGAARDLALRLLARLPYDADTATWLAARAGDDPAWERRFTCVETLAAFGARPEVLAALRAAASDPDARVASRARELLDRLSGR